MRGAYLTQHLRLCPQGKISPNSPPSPAHIMHFYISNILAHDLELTKISLMTLFAWWTTIQLPRITWTPFYILKFPLAPEFSPFPIQLCVCVCVCVLLHTCSHLLTCVWAFKKIIHCLFHLVIPLLTHKRHVIIVYWIEYGRNKFSKILWMSIYENND